MSLIGLDPQRVLVIAQALDTQRQSVITVSDAVGSLVASSPNVWKGNDVAHFQAQWTTHRRDLQAASAALAELAAKARQNVLAQIITSDDYSGIAGGGAGGANTISGSAQWVPWSASGSTGGTFLGQPWSADGSVKVGAGAEGSAHWSTGPDGSFDGGVDGSAWVGAQATGHAQWGSNDYNLKADGTANVGAGADGSASITANSHGATLSADGKVWAGANADGSINAHTPFADVGVDGSAEVGVGANGSVYSHAGDDGVAAGVEGGYFAGAQVGVEQKVSVGGGLFSAHAGVDGQAGAGVDGGADYSITSHDVGFDISGGVAEALGVKGDFGIHVDPAKAVDGAADLGSKAIGGISSGASWAKKHLPFG